MVSSAALNLQQSAVADGLAGSWKLVPEHAVTLNPSRAGVLRVTHGQVWATLDGPHHGPANDWGDMVLKSGQQITLLPGQHVVVEPFGDAVNEPAYFSWEPSVALEESSPSEMPGWSTVLMGPFVALGYLVSQIGAGLSWLVAGQGRVLSPLESNQP